MLTFKKGHRNHGAFSSYKDANPMTLQLILERRKWADERASFGVVPKFVTDEWEIDLGVG